MPDSSALFQTKPMDVQANVLHALMLRDMRTRFGGSHWGYVIAVGWPCGHILMIVALMAFRNMVSPLGDSIVLFVATGTMPYISFMYMSRKVMEGLIVNKPLTYFPRVSLFDVVVSRMVVETISSFGTTIFVLVILLCLGVDAFPVYPSEVLFAYLATVIVGLGIGMINANIVAYFPGWNMGYILIIIGGYSASGVFFLPDLFPSKVYDVLSWNPLLHCIAWFRMGYYPDYNPPVAKLYVIMFGFVALAIGLALERFVTRHRLTML